MSAAFDIIVVGAGHAGCEAAAAASRLGLKVACVTFHLSQVARLSCNPAVGGQAKGHLVREIDALGGLMGRVADETCIQFRRLNTRKGLAVQASRAQVDIDRYPAAMRRRLAAIPTLTLIEGEVTELVTVGERVAGVLLGDGSRLDARAVIVTAGTFLSGVMFRGDQREVGGRVGDGASHELSGSLNRLGLRLGRLKTGTVPRLDGRTIDWLQLEAQQDTLPDGRFSYGPPGPRLPQVRCHLAYTTAEAHAHIRQNLDRSPLRTGAIVGRGPRYCPSIEDKVVRFADRERHLLFLEPEGLDTDRIYVNGLSTSLPRDVQDAVVHAIPGLEQARILEYGYAVEYDFSDPTQLGRDLQHRDLRGLYFAGQVNGTSGYEEAAAQGLVAGFSAALGEPFHVERSEGYVGVLVDDLVSRGVGGEPYRMFTSRAEHRLVLREDNADRRLMPRGRELGLIDDETWGAFEERQRQVAEIEDGVGARTVIPTDHVARRLEAAGLTGLARPTTVLQLLARPDVSWRMLAEALDLPALAPEVALQLEVDARYGGYIRRAERRAQQTRSMEQVTIPADVDWSTMAALSREVRERLTAARPETLGQVGRLPGVTPAAVGVVAAWLARSGSVHQGAAPTR